MRFLLLYALAAAGGAVGYVPLLSILLPVRVSLLAGGEALHWLAWITFGGAIAASLANIGFGWLSDRSGNRTYWVAAGLIMTCLLLVAIGRVERFAVLLTLVVVWQITLNMLLSPLAAWAGDCVPDRQKGLLGGLLSFSPALGALCGALVTLPGLASAPMRLVWVAAIVAAMVAPVLLFGRPRPMPHLMPGGAGAARQSRDAAPPDGPIRARYAVVRMWFSRLLVQIAESAMFAFLYYWLRSIVPGLQDNISATIFSIVLAAAIPLTLLIGRWSDRRDRPLVPLVATSIAAVAGLLLMASAHGLVSAVAGYALFGLTASIFLALHSSQTLRVLPRPADRGRDLGLFNLTNTVPSLIMPWLTLMLVPSFGFSGLFLLLAALVTLASLLLASIVRIRPATG